MRWVFQLKFSFWVKNTSCVLFCFAALAGCSSSSVPTEVPEVPELPNFESFDAVLAEGRALGNRIDLAGFETGERPSGSVTYRGSLGFSSDSTNFEDPASVAADPLVMAGRLTLNVDFSEAGVMSGQASQFIDANNNQLDGTIVVTQEFNTSPFAMAQFSGTAIGDVTAANGETYSFGVRYDGSFRGEDSQFVYAYGNADLVHSGQIIAYNMGYVAER